MPKFCSSPWTTIDINTGGLVTPCLCSDWHTHGSIGNLNDNTLEEVLVSSSMQEFRLTILNGSFSKCNTVCHRLANLEDVEKIEHKTTDLNLPTHINIALDKECNLKCPICRNGKVFTGQVNYKILNILQKLTSAYKNFQKKVRIQCDGAGDLFASKSYLKWLWQDDLPNCFELDVITNGNLIIKNKDLILKLKNKLHAVAISIDAATSETYTITRGGKFSIVLEGIKWLIEQDIKVTVSFVVQKLNYKEMVKAWYLCKDYNIRGITFHMVRKWNHMSDEWWNKNRIENNPDIDYTLFKDQLKQLNSAPKILIKDALPPVWLDGNLKAML
tara:strand:+ start:28 stop:1017 length:990 start_codon:yes stop_codon:yes gene_type:complete